MSIPTSAGPDFSFDDRPVASRIAACCLIGPVAGRWSRVLPEPRQADDVEVANVARPSGRAAWTAPTAEPAAVLHLHGPCDRGLLRAPLSDRCAGVVREVAPLS